MINQQHHLILEITVVSHKSIIWLLFYMTRFEKEDFFPFSNFLDWRENSKWVIFCFVSSLKKKDVGNILLIFRKKYQITFNLYITVYIYVDNKKVVNTF